MSASACFGGTPPGTDASPTDPSGACALAASSATCPECSDGALTCGFGGVEVTVPSCGECQTRAALYQALCDAGETADQATIEADTVCAAPSCVEWVNPCADPCAFQCTREDQVPTLTTCDLGCPDTGLPDPGDCVWTGAGGCAFQ